MQEEQWKEIKYFTQSEKWGDPTAMDYNLVRLLDSLRAFIGKKIIIHCGYEDRGNDSYHCRGMAIDCHAVDIHLIDFYIAACRFGFGGIGIYPKWNSPGLHIDSRPVDEYGHKSFWASIEYGKYIPITSTLIESILDMPYLDNAEIINV